jgi:hypothetical protein
MFGKDSAFENVVRNGDKQSGGGGEGRGSLKKMSPDLTNLQITVGIQKMLLVLVNSEKTVFVSL